MAHYSQNVDLLAAVNAIAATASGLPADQMPAAEFIQIVLDGQAAGLEFAMPVGGVRAIIKALTRTLHRHGGQLWLAAPVSRINVHHNTAVGITLADGQAVSAEVVIHNAGPARLVGLMGAAHLPPAYVARLAALKGVECAALVGVTRHPLFTQSPIVMTPACRRVVGVFSPTVLNPALAKNGLHLFDAFFPLRRANRAGELALALADMRDLFPGFDDTLVWTVPMFFTGLWPGAESGQTFGQTGPNRLLPQTPVQNCYLVGMDAVGSGVAGDVIPQGVRQMLAHLQIAL
jgi:phytoene dehydrogenase-like protein